MCAILIIHDVCVFISLLGDIVKLITIEEVAKILPFKAGTLRLMCKDSRLPAKLFGKKWLFNEEKLNEMFNPTIEKVKQ